MNNHIACLKFQKCPGSSKDCVPCLLLGDGNCDLCFIWNSFSGWQGASTKLSV